MYIYIIYLCVYICIYKILDETDCFHIKLIPEAIDIPPRKRKTDFKPVKFLFKMTLCRTCLNEGFLIY